MGKEYPRVERIGTTENATLVESIYPERKTNQYLPPTAVKINDFKPTRWTRDENMMWNYKDGFDVNLAERDRLRFMYSMTTVEHYFNQQKYQIMEYQYDNGSMYIQKKEDKPYGMDVRLIPWNKLVWPQTNDHWAPKIPFVCSSEGSKAELEDVSDIESEYSDY